MLYKILNIQNETDSAYKVEIKLNCEHSIFKGHFPEQPILPGASMVLMLREVIQQIRNCKLELVKGGNIKYVALVIPKEDKNINYSIQTKDNSDGTLSVNATLLSGEVPSMKFSGIYKII